MCAVLYFTIDYSVQWQHYRSIYGAVRHLWEVTLSMQPGRWPLDFIWYGWPSLVTAGLLVSCNYSLEV